MAAGVLSAGHARAILSLDGTEGGAEAMQRLADKIDEAVLDSSTPGGSGKGEVERAARRLLAASELIDAAESDLDRASQALSVLVWHPETTDAAPTLREPQMTAARHGQGTSPSTPVSSPVLAGPPRPRRSPSQGVPGLSR